MVTGVCLRDDFIHGGPHCTGTRPAAFRPAPRRTPGGLARLSVPAGGPCVGGEGFPGPTTGRRTGSPTPLRTGWPGGRRSPPRRPRPRPGLMASVLPIDITSAAWSPSSLRAFRSPPVSPTPAHAGRTADRRSPSPAPVAGRRSGGLGRRSPRVRRGRRPRSRGRPGESPSVRPTSSGVPARPGGPTRCSTRRGPGPPILPVEGRQHARDQYEPIVCWPTGGPRSMARSSPTACSASISGRTPCGRTGQHPARLRQPHASPRPVEKGHPSANSNSRICFEAAGWLIWSRSAPVVSPRPRQRRGRRRDG